MKTILLRHKWISQDGFRVHICEHCGCIRKWNDGWKQLIYTRGTEFHLRTPSCKRIMHCDKVLT